MATYQALVDEYDATADYDVDVDSAKAKRFVAATRGLLRFAASSGRDGTTLQFQLQVLQQQLNQAIAWLDANEEVSEANRTRNPDVLHADFSGFGQYGGDYR